MIHVIATGAELVETLLRVRNVSLPLMCPWQRNMRERLTNSVSLNIPLPHLRTRPTGLPTWIPRISIPEPKQRPAPERPPP